MKKEGLLRSLEVYDKITSTMNLEPPIIPGAVAAVEQASGRGRRGAWTSPPGGAWITIYTETTPPRGLAVAVGGCLARRLEALVPGARLGVKWPNDVYYAGRKLAGILVEARREVLAIGVGVNVYNAEPRGAARLADAGYRGSLGRVYIAVIKSCLDALRGTAGCIAEAAARDILRGRVLRVETPRGHTEGVGAGIGDNGALLLETPEGLVEVECCSVEWWGA